MSEEYGPCVCPWCDKVLLDTTREMLHLRIRLFYEHKRCCTARPTARAQQAAWLEADRQIATGFEDVLGPQRELVSSLR